MANNDDVAGNKVVATVSEPATIVMFSLAFAGLAYRRKQFKQK